MKKIILITGPTGTGKTKLSIAIAKRYQGQIINGDAFQIYKDMNILNAKIKPEEKENIPHHMLDIKEINEEYSVADYQKDVRAIIDTLHQQNKIPILVGGSGLYLDSVIYNYTFPATKRESKTEKQYLNLSNDELHNLLKSLHPEIATAIHKNNRKRVLRAIELAKEGEVVTQFNNELLYDVKILYLEEERSLLYKELNRRVDQMVEEGLVEEVRKLAKMNISRTASSAIGYKEILPYLQGEISLEEAIELVKKNTRHYAKRQITWFKKESILLLFPLTVFILKILVRRPF